MNKIYVQIMIVSCLICFVPILHGQNSNQKLRVLSKTNSSNLNKLQLKLSEESLLKRQEAYAIAKQKGWEIKGFDKEKQSFYQLMRVDNGHPIYYVTDNTSAAASTRANQLNTGGSLGLNLNGEGMEIYVWDSGHARMSHNEFDGAGGQNRVTAIDGTAEVKYHSSHVMGTILASGYDSKAKGMAPYAKGYTAEWTDDEKEVAAKAAEGMLISNHSYGLGAHLVPDYYFGMYIDSCVKWDEIMYNAPYYLMVKSAGNDGTRDTYNESPLDGNSAYDKLLGAAVCKNNLVVGNVVDVNVDAEGNILSQVQRHESSSEGPTDDYRIKPDIMANGYEVYSCGADSDNDYKSLIGTSMAAPNASGTLLLLQQHYNKVNESFMKAATLKGLALHTADDVGQLGPDSKTGWGLLNAKRAAQTISDKVNIIKELTLAEGETFTAQVTASGNLQASISWTDVPGVEKSSGSLNSKTPVLVNDLDIRISKNSESNMPWKLTGLTTNTKGDNNVDPYERVDVNNASGTYTVTISHKGKLVNGKQNFSLIITGISSSTIDVEKPTTPQNLAVSKEASQSMYVSWNASTDNVAVTGYDIYLDGKFLRKSKTNSVYLTGLNPSQAYAVKVRAFDKNNNVSEFASTNGETTSGGTDTYCDLSSSTSEYEWISNVTFGEIEVSSERSTYTNYTKYSTRVKHGESIPLSITKGWKFNPSREAIRVWIDWNQDGDFSDADELAWQSPSSTVSPVNGIIVVPNSAKDGITRMRVALKSFSYASSPCGSYTNGEVEDYSVVVGEGIDEPKDDTEAPTAPLNMSASNIAQTSATLSWGASQDNVGVTGYDLYQDGNLVKTVTTLTVDVTGLDSDTDYAFYVKAKDAAGNVSQASNAIKVKTINGNDVEAPTAPLSLEANDVAETTVVLSWKEATDNIGVTAYDVYSANNNLLKTVNGLSVTLINLESNTEYVFYVKAKDKAGNVSAASNNVTVKTLSEDKPLSYCNFKGRDASYEWIEYIGLNNMENKSGSDKGYGDYTSKVANVPYGSNTMYLGAGYDGGVYTENWYVWIDYNQNGVFETSEKVKSGSSKSRDYYKVSFVVPNTAKKGKTRMRVAMSYRSLRGEPCGSFTYGEVEDYTVNIGSDESYTAIGGSQIAFSRSLSDINEKIEVNVYPNPPISGNVNVKSEVSEGVYDIIDIRGIRLQSGAFSDKDRVFKIHTDKLSSGRYFIVFKGERDRIVKSLLVK